MALTDINSEDRLVQRTFAEYLENALGWDSVYAYNTETFGPQGTLGRASEREVVLVREPGRSDLLPPPVSLSVHCAAAQDGAVPRAPWDPAAGWDRGIVATERCKTWSV